MATLADFMSGNQNPGLALPPGMPQPYADNVGPAPMAFSDVLQSLQQSQQPPQKFMQPQQMAQQSGLGNLSIGGDPASLSGRIQEWLGAKPQDQGGQVQDILAGRFQQQVTPQGQQMPAQLSDILSGRYQTPLSMNDVGIAAQQTAATGAYVPAQQIANQRATSSFDALSKIADLQKSQGEANYYNALSANGGGRGEGITAAMRIMSDYNSNPDVVSGKKPAMTFTNAYMAATAKQGQGVTFDQNGNETTFGNAPQAAATMSQGKESGTQIAKQQFEPVTAGLTQNAKNQSNIAAAAPEAAQKEIGQARGEATVNLATLQSGLPQLNAVVSDLQNLGQAATYTKGGQLYNDALRQLNLQMSAGGDARAEYVSRVDNVLLPSLKAIFGSRVTNYDLQAARSMMVNPDLSPTEKSAQLKAFIDQRNLQVNTDTSLVNSLGGTAPTPGQNPTANIPAQNAAQSGGVVKFSDLPQ